MSYASQARYSPTIQDWLRGARPHTWANAFAPVIAGTGAAVSAGYFHAGRAMLALVVAWALIVGVNYANDYSDGIRGTDDDRTGPQRLTAGKIARPQHVKLAAFAAFGVAALAGIALCVSAGTVWMLLLGALCIAGAWFYTGGSKPYGYMGLGEVAIFIFFGLIAVLGTQYTQAHTINWIGVLLAIGIGCMSSAVNLANNIRDIPTDREAGKITLAVRLGDARSRLLFTLALMVPAVLSIIIAVGLAVGRGTFVGTVFALVALAYFPQALRAIRTVNGGAKAQALIPVLGDTGRAMLLWSLIIALAVTFF